MHCYACSESKREGGGYGTGLVAVIGWEYDSCMFGFVLEKVVEWWIGNVRNVSYI